jgi:catechol 2,3-dioxygenase-like lactoylglutathione lyase family enzyme
MDANELNQFDASFTDATLRIARPSRDLAAAERFWCGGVGFDVLWRTEPDHSGEHQLLMVGMPGARWHLELVQDPELLAAHPPSEEDLLVLYLGRPASQDWVERTQARGGRRVPARNTYWDQWGITLEDPDGYRLVLSHRSWD